MKTCTRCGLERPLESFRMFTRHEGKNKDKRKQYRDTICIVCRRADPGLKKWRKVYHKRRQKQINDQTASVATRRNVKWTKEEDDVLRSDVTAIQAARMLGRTLCAVQVRRLQKIKPLYGQCGPPPTPRATSVTPTARPKN